ncbi:MAG TPA: Uma2 family endonuclease [Pyrinomonadaceae bacterium]|nr:Uma2 family endonuclease [Pyrinomonadaceae bacterium]
MSNTVTARTAEPEKTSVVKPKRFSVEEFYKMTEAGILPEESGWEVIDGYLLDKMTIGSKHASIVKRLNRILTNLVANQAVISIQDPVHIDEYNEPEPDIALLEPREDFYAAGHPSPPDVLLLIEVSDSTVEYDREIKKTLYAEAGIPEFWLVNLKNETIEVYTQPKNGSYYSARILEAGETIDSKSIENLTLSVAEILGA